MLKVGFSMPKRQEAYLNDERKFLGKHKVHEEPNILEIHQDFQHQTPSFLVAMSSYRT
jgi:hypothetical protein